MKKGKHIKASEGSHGNHISSLSCNYIVILNILGFGLSLDEIELSLLLFPCLYMQATMSIAFHWPNYFSTRSCFISRFERRGSRFLFLG